MTLPPGLSIYPGDSVLSRFISSASPDGVRATAVVECSTGPDEEDYVLRYYSSSDTTFISDRTWRKFKLTGSGGDPGGGCPVVGGGIRLENVATVTKRGEFYVRFLVARAPSPEFAGMEECLCCGYLSDSYPFIPIGEHTEPGPGGGEGAIRTVTGTDPAAGAESTETVPANALWRLRAYSIVLVTDATVANRFSELIVDRGAVTDRLAYLRDPQGLAHAASLTVTHSFLRGPGGAIWSSATISKSDTQTVYMNEKIPEGLFLIEGDRIRTSSSGLAAGDDYAAPRIEVEEWLVV